MGKGKYGLIPDLNHDGAWYSPHTSVLVYVKGEGNGDYTVRLAANTILSLWRAIACIPG